MAGITHTSMAGNDLPAGVTAASFQTPPNEYRIVQYQLTRGTLSDYPQWGIGGYMGFFYKNLYKQGPKGVSSIGPLVDAAKKSGRPVWLADDWGYPSGMAGGRVVAENPDFEVRSLVMLSHKGTGAEPVDWVLPKDLHDIIYAALYPVTGSGIDVRAGKRVAAQKRNISAKGISGGWELRVFARYTRSKNTQGQSTMKQFGHTGRYPDLMNRKAMARFIANMHEPILKQISSPAKKVQGFYCNEPNLMQTAWTGKSPYACAPWNADLPALFSRMHGYDLATILPYIFEGRDDTARRARIHYRQTVAELFTDSFARQIKQWCNKRGVKSSGHYLLNDYLAQHVQGYGDMMKFVSEFDVPALDIPIPNPNQFMNFRYQQSRFFSSVTAWKQRDTTLMLLDPIIGGYGMGRLSPELPLLLNSVNMASFHGVNIFTSYLPRTPAKGAKGYTREDYRFLNEYIGRITQVLRGARREAGVGLYYPIAMFQGDLLASSERWTTINAKHKKRQQAWDHTEKALLNGDIEYMIVHPDGVAQARIAQGRMQIGFGVYHTLVVPQLDFIPLAVAKQLARFQKTGGKILWVDVVPRGAEHAKHDAPVKAWLKDAKPTRIATLAQAIPASFSSQFDLSFTPGTDQLVIGRFHQGGKQVYLLVNRLQKAITATVTRKGGAGRVVVLDPSTGKISKVGLPAKLPIQATRALLLISTT
ncbi:MAG: hypothetical protein HN919_19180 [Verrucomicrobia bacterium]|nr:hypothetical protein [Verrucomicrobiota bacterium]MBT7699802.1 hypothetical protein [Verrucomicrobiota bacterium]